MIFVGILYCFVYTFGFSNVYILFCVYIWLFKSHIYMSGELIARYSFMQGFSALHGRFAMAQWLHWQLWGFRSTLWGFSIHRQQWASITFHHAYADFSGSVFGWPLNMKLLFSCFSRFERDSSYPIWLRCAELPVELFEDQFLLHGWF